jgi:hypothetical protein
MEVIEACICRALRARESARQVPSQRIEPRPIVSAVACSTRLFAVHRALRTGR